MAPHLGKQGNSDLVVHLPDPNLPDTLAADGQRCLDGTRDLHHVGHLPSLGVAAGARLGTRPRVNLGGESAAAMHARSPRGVKVIR